jgi:hypothetical protein
MTFVEFVQGLATLTVTGVKRRHTGPPSSIGAADLPVQYPRIPAQATEPRTFSTNGNSATCELAIVVAPEGADTKGANFALACALVDNLNTALGAAMNADSTLDSWSIRQVYETYGSEAGTVYLVLVATVEGSW